MKPTIDTVALCRQAGLCYVDCHFLDSDNLINLLEVTSEMESEENRQRYIEQAQGLEQQRLEKRARLDRFAALVLRHMIAELTRQSQTEEGADGMEQTIRRIAQEALRLEVNGRLLP